jgi:hypothetical protein
MLLNFKVGVLPDTSPYDGAVTETKKADVYFV